MFTLHLVSTLLLMASCVSCRLSASPIPAEWEGVSLRERYIERFPTSSEVIYEPDRLALLEEYHRRVELVPTQMNRVKLRIQDEQGKPLNNVTAKIEWLNPGQFFKPPRLDWQRTKNVDGKLTVSFGWNAMLHIHFSKDGYRNLSWFFSKLTTDFQATEYRDNMEEGRLLPDPNDPEVLIVTLAPVVRWDPPGKHDWITDVPDRKFWPTTLPLQAPVVAVSTDPKWVPAPVRGTYLLLNRDDQVVGLRRLDRGMRIGFQLFEMSNRQQLSPITYFGGISQIDEEKQPFRWILYSKSEPLEADSGQ